MQRRVKVLPPWLNVMMDDIEEEKVDNDMQGKKGIETNEEEHNEDVPWENDLSNDKIPSEQEEEKKNVGVLEGEGSKAKEDETSTSSGLENSSSSIDLGDTPLYKIPPVMRPRIF
ncbi:hypothetical protein GOP47_0009832 [Adiantum capillus-veneris]|uniref:Uncharacterized protein n=1 Tax=Adiantum capillus-veneris TaxID=13818 RepID=A0A9D4UXK8_ADICA|nr:hypothetical protein GOP47_0009832 [Adiantum capillus-veneris]